MGRPSPSPVRLRPSGTIPAHLRSVRALHIYEKYLQKFLANFRLVGGYLKRPSRLLRVDMDAAEKPESAPLFWIAKWVDFQNKKFLGCCLSEGHFGVNFEEGELSVLRDQIKIQDVTYEFLQTKKLKSRSPFL